MRKLIIIAAACALVACSSDDTNNNGDAGGGNDAGGEAAGNMATQTGRIVDFDNSAPVKGATITLSPLNITTTTDNKGAYSVSVPKGTPYTMSVTAPTYLKLIEQEWQLSGDTDRGDTSFVSTATESTLQLTLSGYDSSLAVLSVQAIATGSCTSVTGATIAIEPPGQSKVKYFAGGFPSNTATAVTDGQLPSVIIYNIDPTAPFKVVVTPPDADAGADAGPASSCKAAAFPFVDPKLATVTYTGNVTVEPTDAASFMRVYME